MGNNNYCISCGLTIWNCTCVKVVSVSESPETANCLPSGKPANPIEMLKEIEAYLTFRLIADEPTVPAGDMRQMKNDIADVLRKKS